MDFSWGSIYLGTEDEWLTSVTQGGLPPQPWGSVRLSQPVLHYQESKIRQEASLV